MNSIQKYQIKGVVQGVGFRPFIVKIADQLKINGWILNDSNGVTLEIEGADEKYTAIY
jgi:hydrogenase maturation protein HypF